MHIITVEWRVWRRQRRRRRCGRWCGVGGAGLGGDGGGGGGGGDGKGDGGGPGTAGSGSIGGGARVDRLLAVPRELIPRMVNGVIAFSQPFSPADEDEGEGLIRLSPSGASAPARCYTPAAQVVDDAVAVAVARIGQEGVVVGGENGSRYPGAVGRPALTAASTARDLQVAGAGGGGEGALVWTGVLSRTHARVSTVSVARLSRRVCRRAAPARARSVPPTLRCSTCPPQLLLPAQWPSSYGYADMVFLARRCTCRRRRLDGDKERGDARHRHRLAEGKGERPQPPMPGRESERG